MIEFVKGFSIKPSVHPKLPLPPSLDNFLGIPSKWGEWSDEQMLECLFAMRDQILADFPFLELDDPELFINEIEPLKSTLLKAFLIDDHRMYLEMAHNSSHCMARKIKLDANKEIVSNLMPKQAGVQLWKLSSLLTEEMGNDAINLYSRIDKNELSEFELIGFLTRTLAHPLDEQELLTKTTRFRIEVGRDLEFLPVEERILVLHEISYPNLHKVLTVSGDNCQIVPLQDLGLENNGEEFTSTNFGEKFKFWRPFLKFFGLSVVLCPQFISIDSSFYLTTLTPNTLNANSKALEDTIDNNVNALLARISTTANVSVNKLINSNVLSTDINYLNHVNGLIDDVIMPNINENTLVSEASSSPLTPLNFFGRFFGFNGGLNSGLDLIHINDNLEVGILETNNSNVNETVLPSNYSMDNLDLNSNAILNNSAINPF
jgi:hypothetical protein